MSAATVRAGGTDPREIEKLLERGVHVFIRRNLHAKLIVSNNSVICGSANISKNSQNVLDEAAVWTNEPAVIQRARTFIDRLCIEPIRPEYLKECKRIYRPPQFHGQKSDTARLQKRVRHARLWIVNLYESSIPDAEIKRYEQGEAKAAKLVKATAGSATDSFNWHSRPKMEELEVGDWLIQAITYKDKSIMVYPPGQLLLVDKYDRGAHLDKERWVFHLEIPKRGESMAWKQFRSATKAIAELEALALPRTKPVRDVQAADRVLSLWTPTGRLSRR
jgi:hypothetical protein